LGVNGKDSVTGREKKWGFWGGDTKELIGKWTRLDDPGGKQQGGGRKQKSAHIQRTKRHKNILKKGDK